MAGARQAFVGGALMGDPSWGRLWSGAGVALGPGGLCRRWRRGLLLAAAPADHLADVAAGVETDAIVAHSATDMLIRCACWRRSASPAVRTLSTAATSANARWPCALFMTSSVVALR